MPGDGRAAGLAHRTDLHSTQCAERIHFTKTLLIQGIDAEISTNLRSARGPITDTLADLRGHHRVLNLAYKQDAFDFQLWI